MYVSFLPFVLDFVRTRYSPVYCQVIIIIIITYYIYFFVTPLSWVIVIVDIHFELDFQTS